jgi:hypothetical protein
MILLVPFLLFIASCGGGGGSGDTVDTGTIEDAVDSPPNTVVEAASVLIIPDEYPTNLSNEQAPARINSEMKINFIKGSKTWPVGHVGTCIEGCNYISETDDPLGPWYGESVHFKGIDAGGNNLIYHYKVQFLKDVEISSIGISGASWGILRLLDHAKRELNTFDLSDITGKQTLTFHTYGATDKIFYLEEIDDNHTEFRYRSKIELNYSQACASQADIILHGSDFSDISNVTPSNGDDSEYGWVVEGDSIWSFWDYAPFEGTRTPRRWVEYEAYLTEGKWNIGLCAINQNVWTNGEGLGPNPSDRYPYFEVSNSLSDEIIMIPASDILLNSGHFSINIPKEKEGKYTVRFWWLNDYYSDDGTNIFDANIKIARVYFDLIDDEDERDNSDRSDDRDDDDDGDDRDDDDDGDDRDDDGDGDDRDDDDDGDDKDDDGDGDDRDDDDDGDDNGAVWIDRNPVSINGNNMKIYLHKGVYTKNLIINGNNTLIIGNAGIYCGDSDWSILSGTVTINGNNAVFRNVELGGEIYEYGNNIVYDNVCY